jgi:integrase
LSAKLIEKTFDWGDYGGVKTAIETMGDVINKFCEDYKQGRLSKGHDPSMVEQTLQNNFLKYLNKLDKDISFDVKVLAKELESMGHTATRRLKSIAYANLADSVGVDHNLRSLAGGYSYKSVNPKMIPSDNLIADVYGKIKSKRWRTIYALMATYGLRNHESFRLDFSDFPVLFVEKGKTSERLIYPLYPEWADSWLSDIVMPKVNLERSNLQLGRDVVTWFSRNNSIVPFNAYTLRHAWARRSMEFGWDLTLAAKQMGHSVKVHSDIYHAWLSQDVYDKAYQLILDNPNRPKPPL